MPGNTHVDCGAPGEYVEDVRSDAVRVGDAVVYTSRLNQEYRYTVTNVDETWITFETGQQVHKDRFDRESFAVVRHDGEAPTPVVIDDDATEPIDSAVTETIDSDVTDEPSGDVEPESVATGPADELSASNAN